MLNIRKHAKIGTRKHDQIGRDFARDWTLPEGPVDDTEPLILIEAADGAEAQAVWRRLGRSGYRTMWCPGPVGGYSSKCPLLEKGHCDLVDQADGVITMLDLREGSCRAIVEGLNKIADQKPVLVEPQPSMAETAQSLLDRCSILPVLSNLQTIVDALDVAALVGLAPGHSGVA